MSLLPAIWDKLNALEQQKYGEFLQSPLYTEVVKAELFQAGVNLANIDTDDLTTIPVNYIIARAQLDFWRTIQVEISQLVFKPLDGEE